MEYDINVILIMNLVPVILSPSAKRMIKLSIQNVIPLVQHLFSSRLKSSKERIELDGSLRVPVLQSERFLLYLPGIP